MFCGKRPMCSREKGHKGLCDKKRVDGFWEKSAPRRKHKLSLLNTEIDNVNMDIIQAQPLQNQIAEEKRQLGIEIEIEKNNRMIEIQSLQDKIVEEKRKFEEEQNNIDIEVQSLLSNLQKYKLI